MVITYKIRATNILRLVTQFIIITFIIQLIMPSNIFFLTLLFYSIACYSTPISLSILIVSHKFDSSHRFKQKRFVEWSHIWNFDKIKNLWDVLFVFLLSWVRFTYPDCFFLLLHYKRYCFLHQHHRYWNILFCDQSFLALLTQWCRPVILVHSNKQQGTVVCALCWMHKIVQEAFNSPC
jgi:hypothetical protein